MSPLATGILITSGVLAVISIGLLIIGSRMGPRRTDAANKTVRYYEGGDRRKV